MASDDWGSSRRETDAQESLRLVAQILDRVNIIDARLKEIEGKQYDEQLEQHQWTRDSVRKKIVLYQVFFGAIMAQIAFHYIELALGW